MVPLPLRPHFTGVRPIEDRPELRVVILDGWEGVSPVGDIGLMVLTCPCEAKADVAGELVVGQRSPRTWVLQPVDLVDDDARPGEVVK